MYVLGTESNPNVLSFTVGYPGLRMRTPCTAAELRVTLADQTCKACHAAILTERVMEQLLCREPLGDERRLGSSLLVLRA